MDHTVMDLLDDESDVGLNKLLHEMQKTDTLTNFTITVSKKKFKVHSVVMAAASNYFRNLLKYEKDDNVTLRDVNAVAVANVIEFIYSNKVTGDKASSKDLLACAVYLQVPSAIDSVAGRMLRQINPSNCLDFLLMFEEHSLKFYTDNCRRYIRHNTKKILPYLQAGKLSCVHFCKFAEFWGNSQWDLLLTILDWIKVDPENHKVYELDLLCHVRYCLMTPTELGKIKNMDICMNLASKTLWLEQYKKALKYHKLEPHRKVISEVSVEASDPMPVFLNWQKGNGAYMEAHNKTWIKQRGMKPKTKLVADQVIVVNNFLVVCERAEIQSKRSGFADRASLAFLMHPTAKYANPCGHANITDQDNLSEMTWSIFNPNDLTWFTMAKMKGIRNDYALAHCGNYLYVMGGAVYDLQKKLKACTDDIVVYNFETNEWSYSTSTLNPRLPVPRYCHSACTLSDSIYVAGGFNNASITNQKMRGYLMPAGGDRILRVDCYNTKTKRWETKAPILEKWHVISAMKSITYKNEDYILIVHAVFNLEFYNPRTDQWTVWSSYSTLRSRLMYEVPGKVVIARSSLFYVDFDRNGEYRDENGEVQREEGMFLFRRACVEWKLNPEKGIVKELPLGDYPIYDRDGEEDDDEKDPIDAYCLLSFPPRSTKKM